MNSRELISTVFAFLLFTTSYAQQGKWTAQKANTWYAQQGWLRGCNFQPSTAFNNDLIYVNNGSSCKLSSNST